MLEEAALKSLNGKESSLRLALGCFRCLVKAKVAHAVQDIVAEKERCRQRKLHIRAVQCELKHRRAEGGASCPAFSALQPSQPLPQSLSLDSPNLQQHDFVLFFFVFHM